MKKNYKSKILGMSIAAAMLLGSSAYAGKIIGVDAGTPYEDTTPPTQYGFGGWNFDNVVVNITSDSDYNDIIHPDIHIQMTETDGTYPEMNDTLSFESKISGTEIGFENEIRGLLHGKDWPVGEPAGIKVINSDTKVKHGKPKNCIMTTSYLSADKNPTGLDGSLDTVEGDPAPVICSSTFQTHKRFKVNLQPTTVSGLATLVTGVNTVAGGLGNPVDLVFNLDMTDDSNDSVRYQVFSKINNYTGMRLNGYKIEVLNGDGLPDENLTLSIGIDEGDEDDDGVPDSDIWGDNELANFAHGLWGPIDKHFTEIGFFDAVRAYYPTALNEANNTITGTGPLAGGNYIDLFGDWLHSGWAPQGIFFDDDNNPDTDAELMAFWGVPPETDLPIGWYKGIADGWAPVEEATLLTWARNPLYSMGAIEDVLNLGLNYIVNVGPNNQIAGGKFIIRITPVVDTNQTEPIHMSKEASLPVITSVGSIVIVPEPTFVPGDTLTVAVADSDLNVDPALSETTEVLVAVGSNDINVTLTETDVNSSVFTGTVPTDISLADGTVVTATYIDESDGNATRIATTIADSGSVTPPPSDDLIPSSGGGGCTYNPDSKHFDMMFLVMMALGLLYPFRRRFIK